MEREGSVFRLHRRDGLVLGLVVAIHVGMAVYLREVVGFDITANPGFRPWDWWWQTIPRDLLANDLWRSLWYLHSQPPLFNLYGAIFFCLFPNSPMITMQFGNILLGGLTSGAVFLVLLLMTQKRWLAATVGVLLAVSPGPFLFEAYILYDVLSCFLVTLTVCLLAFYSRTKNIAFAAGFMLALSILVLTRSAYHIIILPAAIVILVLSSTRDWRRILVVSVIISVIPFSWYAKNQALYGFFGASSWGGFNLWKVASASYSSQELEQLANDGVISHVAGEVEIFRPASAYVKYGFDLMSDIPVLNRDDQHNIKMIAVAKSYQRSALQLIRRDPERYLQSVFVDYGIYNIPSLMFKHHVINAGKLPPGVMSIASYVDGAAFSPVHGINFGSFLFFLIPLCLVGYLAVLTISSISIKGGLLGALKRMSVETWIFILISYTTIVSLLLETGENGRERFYVEQLIFVLLAYLAVWGISRVRSDWHRTAV